MNLHAQSWEQSLRAKCAAKLDNDPSILLETDGGPVGQTTQPNREVVPMDRSDEDRAAFHVGSAESRNAGADIPGAAADGARLARLVLEYCRIRTIESLQRP